ncbi:anti-sigma factor [Streptomyces sp. HPF1205]|uniref:anti-sigma factor family protein n=1 Tax=Streptomyces sp. HPF1205 TaxID=2873262 RepID=UPI001CED2152|nr:zf-HC2 domain-containing protein [Streptomyces sp. HPF1205]
MSSSGTGEDRSAPAEQHLGDRLAAFVDGELTGDSRDRVLAHLATCPQCKAAAAEQRRLKSVVAASELPAISAGLLARLQGLPGMDGGDGSPPRAGHGPDRLPDRVTGRGGEDRPARRRGPFELLGSAPGADAGPGLLGAGRRGGFSYLTPAHDLLADADSPARGFRVHEPSRGRRFAFAAAGAFSMAAIALGSALPMEAAVDGSARPDDGPAVSPVSANSVSDTRGVVPRGVLESTRRPAVSTPATAPPPVVFAAAAAAITVPVPGSTHVRH